MSIITEKRHEKWILLLFLNIIFIFSFISSPLYNHSIYIGDACIYQNIAKEMLNGRVLYRDIFDIKGPFIFFIYMVHFLFPSLNIGAYIIEAILYSSIFYLHYKTIRLKNNELVSFAFILGELIFLNHVYSIVCPDSFALLTFSYMNYWILSKQYLNPTKLQLILCGILTGIVFWIKFSLGVPIAIIYFYVIYNVFKNKLPGKINYFIYPLLGFMIPTLVVLGYFIYHGAISDLVYCYFIISAGYKNPNSLPFNTWFIVLSVLVFILLISMIYNILKTRYEMIVLDISYLLLIIPVFLMTKNLFEYYFIPFLAVIPLISMFDIFEKVSYKIISPILAAILTLLLISTYNLSNNIVNSASWFRSLDSFAEDVNFNPDSAAVLYLSENPILGPLESINYKYFFMPNLTYEQYPDMWDTVYEDISNKNIEYLILKYGDEAMFNEESPIDKHLVNVLFIGSDITMDFIDKMDEKIIENYDFYNKYSGYMVYKRK